MYLPVINLSKGLKSLDNDEPRKTKRSLYFGALSLLAVAKIASNLSKTTRTTVKFMYFEISNTLQE